MSGHKAIHLLVDDYDTCIF